MLGTKWVAPGEGATIRELYNAIPAEGGGLNEWEREQALKHVGPLARMGKTMKTNLALTGEPLTDYDLRRIAVCE